MRELAMTDSEIVRNYNEAKDKKAQIGILADLNATTKSEIKRILGAAGVQQYPSNPDALAVGQRIAMARHRMGLTGAALARYINVSSTMIYRYEHGQSTPSDDMLAAIADLLHTTAPVLLGQTAPDEPSDEPQSGDPTPPVQETVPDQIAPPAQATPATDKPSRAGAPPELIEDAGRRIAEVEQLIQSVTASLRAAEARRDALTVWLRDNKTEVTI